MNLLVTVCETTLWKNFCLPERSTIYSQTNSIETGITCHIHHDRWKKIMRLAVSPFHMYFPCQEFGDNFYK